MTSPLAQAMENMQLELIRRDYFDATKATILLKQYKLELWPGHVTSMELHPPGSSLLCLSNVTTLGRWPHGCRPVVVGSHPIWPDPPRSV